MDPIAANVIPEGRLRLSRAPVAELAAGALRAKQAAGLDRAEYLIVAIPVGAGSRELVDAVEAAARAVP